MKKPKFYLQALLLSALGLTNAVAVTAAGTQIINQATGNYVRPDGSVGSGLQSNPVYTVVNPVCSVSILSNGTVAQPGQTVQVSALPATAVFKYTITNSGNQTQTFPLSATSEAGSSFAPSMTVYRDANANGVVDSGDAPLSSITLAAGEQAALLLVATTSAHQGAAYVNLVTSCADGSVTDSNNVSKMVVQLQPSVAIGPVGNPEATEDTLPDWQTIPAAVTGQQVCMDHTLKNTGLVRDTFNITVTYPQGSAQSQIYGADGKPLALPVTLDPGQSVLVKVCYTPTQSGTLEALITVTGALGSSNVTRDKITRVDDRKPELTKSVSPAAGTKVKQEQEIIYTLTIRNPYDTPLTNLVVTDALPAHLDFVSASDGGQFTPPQVTWTIPKLAGGETRSLTVTAKVNAQAVDGEYLKNVFSMVSSETPTPTNSNEVSNPVWTHSVDIQKGVNQPEASIGDLLTYTLKVTNLSPTTGMKGDITDIPATGLEYTPGTATLNGKPLADPVVKDGKLVWANVDLPAQTPIVITYQMRVTPAASGQLKNVVEVIGEGPDGLKDIANSSSDARIRVLLRQFEPVSDIIGKVYIDRNRNGNFDQNLDTPVERARLLLAGGRLSLTDKDGRYHFSNVPLGTHAVRLDLNTTPYAPLMVPQEGGLAGTQTVHVRGLTSFDFPLAPVVGDIVAIRSTTLSVGDVQLLKTVYRTENGYAVTLKVTSQRALTLSLNDPLPQGATLSSGQNVQTVNAPAGESTYSYTFTFDGSPEEAVTDPNMQWRN